MNTASFCSMHVFHWKGTLVKLYVQKDVLLGKQIVHFFFTHEIRR